MNVLGRVLISALLVISTAISQRAAAEPFLHFATGDPFGGEASSRKNDIHVFGGPSVENTFGGSVRFWEADYTDNYMIGAAYGRDLKDIGAGFVLGGVAGAAIRFGDDDDASGELWAGLRLRHHGLVIGNLVIAPGVAAGLSVVSAPTRIERQREVEYGGDATFLGFIGPEVALRFRQAPQVEFVYQIHHRSGGEGLFGDMGEGSNVSTLGIRYRF